MLKNCLLTIGVVVIIVAVYFPARHARHYSYISTENIYKELVFIQPKNGDYNLKNCTYQDTILNNEDIKITSITKKKKFRKPYAGGEYKPDNCRALIKTALIIPYKNRVEQLHIFLNYIHYFLQKQNIHYRILVVEQNDTLPFNRAKC
ncbi:hypothetical protein NQ318_011875 [Aromia moschata]|uniref:Galactosyltransferase N-terminal domain-containing protein n=1 Tax=Aromia moschata TaxID=1265417 RepID=A0AAV8XWN6_9CUCU|nr:hypothetical protein NQ318_011875 [Aromia moschata]